MQEMSGQWRDLYLVCTDPSLMFLIAPKVMYIISQLTLAHTACCDNNLFHKHFRAMLLECMYLTHVFMYYCIQQNIRGGKLSRLQEKTSFAGKVLRTSCKCHHLIRILNKHH